MFQFHSKKSFFFFFYSWVLLCFNWVVGILFFFFFLGLCLLWITGIFCGCVFALRCGGENGGFGWGGCCSDDSVMVDLSDQIRFVLSGPFSGFRCNYCV